MENHAQDENTHRATLRRDEGIRCVSRGELKTMWLWVTRWVTRWKWHPPWVESPTLANEQVNLPGVRVNLVTPKSGCHDPPCDVFVRLMYRSSAPSAGSHGTSGPLTLRGPHHMVLGNSPFNNGVWYLENWVLRNGCLLCVLHVGP